MNKMLFSGFRSFMADRRGNAIVVFAFSAFVIIVATGGALDFTRAQTERSRLQDAADAATLRATSLTEVSEAEQQAAADKTFELNQGSSGLHIVSRTLSKVVSGNNTDLTYNVEAELDTVFLHMVGFKTLPLSVVSKAQAQLRKSEIVLVLDATGSMQGDRMTHLKTSVETVLNELDNGSGNKSGTKVGIVPFNTQVRIPPAIDYDFINYREATGGWTCVSGVKGCSLVLEAYNKVCYHAADPVQCKSRAKIYYRTYVESGRNYTEVTAVSYEGSTVYTSLLRYYITQKWQNGGTSCNKETGKCTSYDGKYVNAEVWEDDPYQKGQVKLTYDEKDYNKSYGSDSYNQSHFKATYSTSSGFGAAESKTVTSSSRGVPTIIHNPAVKGTPPKQLEADGKKSEWKGCITDRLGGYDTSWEAPKKELTNSLYIAAVCSSNDLAEVMELTEDISKAKSHIEKLKPAGETNITIGMQWGLEVLSPPAPMTGGVEFGDKQTLKYLLLVTDGENKTNGFGESIANIDKRTKKACETAKSKGVTVFVVRVMEGNTELLRNCASRPEYFYDLKSADQLGQALQDVFNAMKKTRLTQ